MSTITKEWLQQKIAEMESARDEIPFGLDEDDNNTLAALRIALASVEAEPVAWAHRLINKRNGVVHPWVYGSAETSPSEGDIFNIEVMPLYAAPPAPVSVPEWTNEQCLEFMSIAFRHAEIKGDLELDDIRLGVRMVNGSRAAMLQGAQPVSNRDELPDVELDTNESDRHWYLVSWCAKGGYAGFTDIYLSSPWANGSARKVAEIISELNMVTGLVITSVFSMPAAPQWKVK